MELKKHNIKTDFTCFHLLFNVATRKCKITYMASLYFHRQRREKRAGGEGGDGTTGQSQHKVLCKMEACGVWQTISWAWVVAPRLFWTHGSINLGILFPPSVNGQQVLLCHMYVERLSCRIAVSCGPLKPASQCDSNSTPFSPRIVSIKTINYMVSPVK